MFPRCTGFKWFLQISMFYHVWDNRKNTVLSCYNSCIKMPWNYHNPKELESQSVSHRENYINVTFNYFNFIHT